MVTLGVGLSLRKPGHAAPNIGDDTRSLRQLILGRHLVNLEKLSGGACFGWRKSN